MTTIWFKHHSSHATDVAISITVAMGDARLYWDDLAAMFHMVSARP